MDRWIVCITYRLAPLFDRRFTRLREIFCWRFLFFFFIGGKPRSSGISEVLRSADKSELEACRLALVISLRKANRHLASNHEWKWRNEESRFEDEQKIQPSPRVSPSSRPLTPLTDANHVTHGHRRGKLRNGTISAWRDKIAPIVLHFSDDIMLVLPRCANYALQLFIGNVNVRDA